MSPTVSAAVDPVPFQTDGACERLGAGCWPRGTVYILTSSESPTQRVSKFYIHPSARGELVSAVLIGGFLMKEFDHGVPCLRTSPFSVNGPVFMYFPLSIR